MNKVNNTGYTVGTPTNNNPYNIIPSNHITMANVDKSLVLIPIINGKPNHDKKVVANPGDEDYKFGANVEGVLEIPFAQYQYGVINPSNNGTYNPYGKVDYSSQFSNSYNPDYYNSSLGGVNNQSLNVPNSINNPIFSVNNGYSQGLIRPESNQLPTSNSGIISQPNDGNPIFSVNDGYSQGLIRNDSDMSLGAKVDSMLNSKNGDSGNTNNADNTTNIDKESNTNGKNTLSDVNPYGDFGMENSAMLLGASIKSKNALGIAGGAGKLLMQGLRNAVSGYAGVKKAQDVSNEAKERDRLARASSSEYSPVSYAQKGGLIPNDSKLMTGNFLDGNNEHPNPNVEVERGEYLQTADGNTMEVLGKKHSEGGELVELPPDTAVVSDYLKVGAKNATYFKKNFGINVSAGSTYATVLDRYKQKIGLTDLLDKETKLINKIKDQEGVGFESTRNINLQTLSEKVNELKPSKAEMEDKFNSFTAFVFDKQEKDKEKEKSKTDFMQDGGQVDASAPQGGGEQGEMEQLITAYAQAKGVDPTEIISALQQSDPQQQKEMLSQMASELQSGGEASNGANQESQVEEIISKYAQLTGEDASKIIEYLSQMSEEQAQQAISKMAQAVKESSQQGGGAPQGGGNPSEGDASQIIQAYAQAKGVDPTQISQSLQQASPDEQKQALTQMVSELNSTSQETPMAKDGGSVGNGSLDDATVARGEKMLSDTNKFKQNSSLGNNAILGLPSQENLKPVYFQNALRTLSASDATPIKMSAVDNLVELNKQYQNASNVSVASNPYASGALLANLQSQINTSSNQAQGNVNLANMQNEQAINNSNVDRQFKVDSGNIAMADAYGKDQAIGQDHYANEWVNYIDNNNRRQVANYNLQRLANSANAISPNFKIGSNGVVYNEDGSVNMQKQMLFDNWLKSNKKVTTSTTESKNGVKKTVTQRDK